VTVIEARGLRKEFTVRVKSGWLRRHTRLVAAVDGIALTVERGEMVGYIGPNGAGKSTTLKMLTGVLYPSAGQVRVCGLEPVPQRTRLARRIGVVFGQRSQLWWDLPLRESFALLRHVYAVGAAEHATAGGYSISTPSSTSQSGSSRWASGCGASSLRHSCTGPRCCSSTSRRSGSTW